MKAKSVLDKLAKGIELLEVANRYATIMLSQGCFYEETPLVQKARKELVLGKKALKTGMIPQLEKLEDLVSGLTRTAEVITQETRRLKQIEEARIKLDQKIKQPIKVEKAPCPKMFCCFSAGDEDESEEEEIIVIEMAVFLPKGNKLSVEPIGVDAPIIDPEEL